MRMQEIVKEEAMSAMEPSSTIAHGGERSPCHPVRWHGKVTRRGQPPRLALQPKQGQTLTRKE